MDILLLDLDFLIINEDWIIILIRTKINLNLITTHFKDLKVDHRFLKKYFITKKQS